MKIKHLLLVVPLFLLGSCVKNSAALSSSLPQGQQTAVQEVKNIKNTSEGNVAISGENEEKYKQTVQEIKKLSQKLNQKPSDEQAQEQAQVLKEDTEKSSETSEVGQETAETPQSCYEANPAEGIPLVPPNARPGECFAIGYLPPKYKVEKVKVLVDEGGEKVIVKPPVYRTVEKKVLVKPETEKIVTIPPVYKTVREKVLVRPATEKIVVVKPAVYKWVTEKVMVEPPRTVWKRGEAFAGKALEKKWDPKTGDILCLVEIPPKYKYIRKKVMVEPPVTKKVVIPPEYKYVEKTVLVKPATTKVVKIPPVYKTVKVKELVEPAKAETVEIPPKYAWVEKRVQVRNPQYLWVKVLCKTNMTPEMIKKLQTALKREGYYDGPIDGIWGKKTQRAVVSYQKEHDLPITPGAVTLKMLKMLNLSF